MLISMKAATSFELPDQDGKIHKLQYYHGKWVVLYFYPKDDTPGCTTEACNFRDITQTLEMHNAVVLGVSKDSVASHKKFAEKYNLNFPLLSDESGETVKAYGAWGLLGIKRTTVLINPQGEIVKEYPGVDPTKHAAEIIADLQTFAGEH
jgi:peroxiredoxin Q/BCP